MAIGERIHFFRTKRGMTQKYVGGQIGFDEKSADVRMAQYEKETRVPKDNLIKALADTFDVNPEALKVPDIDSYVGLMHTLFTLEDRYGLKIEKAEDGQPRLYLDLKHFPDSSQFYDMMMDWMDKSEALESKQISGAITIQLLVRQHILISQKSSLRNSATCSLLRAKKSINLKIRRNNALRIVSAGLLSGKEKGLAKLIFH